MAGMTIRVLASALVLASFAVRAQSRGCVERPSGPALDATGLARPPGLGTARAAVALPGLPAAGQDCIAVMPPVGDVLRGEPAPGGGLLGGGDPLRGPR